MISSTRNIQTVWFAAVLVVKLAAVGPASSAEQANEGRLAEIRHSDVVFMYDGPDKYEDYGCTVLGWAGHADKDRIELAHAKGVRQFSVSVGFLTETRGMIDFSDQFLDAAARNFAGEPFIVPWLWDHKYKGQSAWWWCTNSPLYRQYLQSRLEQRMPTGPDGLHIDDYRGTSGAVTWLSACFCRHCMAGFRQYLADHVSQGDLQKLGITDLASFDYGQFLRDRGVSPSDYPQRRSSLLLADEFYDFHVKSNTAYVGEYRRLAEKIRGKPLTLCVNSGLSNAQALAIAPQLSYFCCEVPHHAESLATATHPIYVYKLGSALGKPITSTASGQDWAYIYEHHKACLVRTWIALSYAFGHNFMAPHRQWCYTKEKGTHWYSGPTEEYAFMYRFVRDHAALLDDYEATALVAVVYDNAANRRDRGKIEPICRELAARNIPFSVVAAGDNWLDYRITAERLSHFKAVVVTGDGQWMDDEQKAVLADVESSGRLVTWPDKHKLASLVPTSLAVSGSEHVAVLPRATTGNAESKAVLHLLNRSYDGQRDEMHTQENFTVQMSCDLFGDQRFTQATLHAPGQQPTRLVVRTREQHLEIDVPRLSIWGIVELDARAGGLTGE